MSDERQASAAADEEVTERTGRREALRRMGKYAVYTAPTLTALTLPLDAAAAKRGSSRGRSSKRGSSRGRPRPHASGR